MLIFSIRSLTPWFTLRILKSLVTIEIRPANTSWLIQFYLFFCQPFNPCHYHIKSQYVECIIVHWQMFLIFKRKKNYYWCSCYLSGPLWYHGRKVQSQKRCDNAFSSHCTKSISPVVPTIDAHADDQNMILVLLFGATNQRIPRIMLSLWFVIPKWRLEIWVSFVTAGIINGQWQILCLFSTRNLK